MRRRSDGSTPSHAARFAFASRARSGSAEAPRSGYTILEVLLAAAIGVLLLGALYVTVDMQVKHTQSAREIVEQSTLARALLARIGQDIAASLGPVDPSRFRTTTSTQTTTSAAGGTTATAQGGTGGAAASTQTSSTQATSSTTQTTSSTATILALQGDASRLILYVSRVPRELNQPAEVLPTVSDVRRITYWLAGGSTSMGLARQEVKLVTSEDALASIPPDIEDEAAHVLAEEVENLTFSYYDGSTWVDSWDGTAAGSDGVTPMGPPPAVAITMSINIPSANGEQRTKQYRHVVAITTANGTTTQTTTAEEAP